MIFGQYSHSNAVLEPVKKTPMMFFHACMPAENRRHRDIILYNDCACAERKLLRTAKRDTGVDGRPPQKLTSACNKRVAAIIRNELCYCPNNYRLVRISSPAVHALRYMCYVAWCLWRNERITHLISRPSRSTHRPRDRYPRPAVNVRRDCTNPKKWTISENLIFLKIRFSTGALSKDLSILQIHFRM